MWVGAFRRIALQKRAHKHKNWNEEPKTQQKLGLLPLVSSIVLSLTYQKDLQASSQCCAGLADITDSSSPHEHIHHFIWGGFSPDHS